jgi:uncharacterized protein YlxW (UPF0749 family)
MSAITEKPNVSTEVGTNPTAPKGKTSIENVALDILKDKEATPELKPQFTAEYLEKSTNDEVITPLKRLLPIIIFIAAIILFAIPVINLKVFLLLVAVALITWFIQWVINRRSNDEPEKPALVPKPSNAGKLRQQYNTLYAEIEITEQKISALAATEKEMIGGIRKNVSDLTLYTQLRADLKRHQEEIKELQNDLRFKRAKLDKIAQAVTAAELGFKEEE